MELYRILFGKTPLSDIFPDKVGIRNGSQFSNKETVCLEWGLIRLFWKMLLHDAILDLGRDANGLAVLQKS